MKRVILLVIFGLIFICAKAQNSYDSITISRFLINDDLLGANWKDTLSSGRYPVYLSEERTSFKTKDHPGGWKTTPLGKLMSEIRANGTGDVAKCFIPRHSINFYSGGKITRYLLICFECDGLRFSDDPPGSYVKSEQTRAKQMAELKTVFKDIL